MYEEVRHRGAWIPADALREPDAGPRLAEWIIENIANLNNRVIVTPVLSNPVDNPPVLAALADDAPHRSANGGPNWQWGSGPVVLAWPGDDLLLDAVSMATNQAIILFEWSARVNFLGWATATEAFNAETGETIEPLPEELHKKFVRTLHYDSELLGGALRGQGREHPQRYLRELADAGLDEDFVVTYALALGEHISPKHIREHYRAATGQRQTRRRR